MFRVSLRYGIPLLIVVFTAVLAAYTVQKEWGAAEAVVRGEAVSQILSRIGMLQKRFSHAFVTGDRERIAEEMSLLGSAPEPQFAILADDTAIVRKGTRAAYFFVGHRSKYSILAPFFSSQMRCRNANSASARSAGDTYGRG